MSADTPSREGMRSWFEIGAFSIEPDSTSETVKLSGANLTSVSPYLSWDYERFTLSSFESLKHCVPPPRHPRALGWPLLKLYYSAFFGAHALMRAPGSGVIRLEPKQAKQLTEYAKIYSLGITISAGTFDFTIRQAQDRSLNVTIKRLPDSGGAHEQFWRRFYSFLTELRDTVVSANEPGATAIITEVSDIQRVLSAEGLATGTWLSMVRNQINYQHLYGVWFPHLNAHAKLPRMDRINNKASSAIRRDLNPTKDPLSAFSAACQTIAAINKDVAINLGRRPSANRFKRIWSRLESES